MNIMGALHPGSLGRTTSECQPIEEGTNHWTQWPGFLSRIPALQPSAVSPEKLIINPDFFQWQGFFPSTLSNNKFQIIIGFFEGPHLKFDLKKQSHLDHVSSNLHQRLIPRTMALEVHLETKQKLNTYKPLATEVEGT